MYIVWEELPKKEMKNNEPYISPKNLKNGLCEPTCGSEAESIEHPKASEKSVKLPRQIDEEKREPVYGEYEFPYVSTPWVI